MNIRIIKKQIFYTLEGICSQRNEDCRMLRLEKLNNEMFTADTSVQHVVNYFSPEVMFITISIIFLPLLQDCV